MVIGLIFSNHDNNEAPVTQVSKADEAQKVMEMKRSAISATELQSAYENNEVNADAQFKDKEVVVAGRVGRIAKDILDNPYITLGDSESNLGSVQCFFAESDEPLLATLSPGQRVYVRGRVDGKLMNVVVKDCSILRDIVVPTPPVAPAVATTPVPVVPVPVATTTAPVPDAIASVPDAAPVAPVQSWDAEAKVWWVNDDTLIAKYGSNLYDTLQKNPAILQALQPIGAAGFNPDDYGVSSPSRIARLQDGRLLLIMEGCRRHFCSDYYAVVAVDVQSSEVFLYEHIHESEDFSGRNDAVVSALLRNVAHREFGA
jgi:hypothetical protein